MLIIGELEEDVPVGRRAWNVPGRRRDVRSAMSSLQAEDTFTARRVFQ
jgi:hypothetical protein